MIAFSKALGTKPSTCFFMPAQTRIYTNARARLRIGLLVTLFRPPLALKPIARKLSSFLRSKNTMQREATQEQQGDANGDDAVQNAAPAAVGTRPPQPRTAPPTETAPPAAAPTPTP